MEPKIKNQRQYEMIWINVLILGYLHACGIYGLYNIIAYQLWTIWWFMFFLQYPASLAITGGYHRLWTHRSYTANLPLRILLATFGTMIYQKSIYVWVRDHRVHHKYSETDADPHNAKRGFFFSHIGWLMVKKHKDVIEKGAAIDLSDLQQDKVVMFQKKYYLPLVLLGTFVIPTLVPYYYWNVDIWTSWCVNTMRVVIGLNMMWCINSVAHMYGPKPYDKTIGPSNNPIMIRLGMGEGCHNYHHVFPWDYKIGEFGDAGRNTAGAMIDMFAWLGWATELKSANKELIEKQAARHGDGSRGFETSTAKFMTH